MNSTQAKNEGDAEVWSRRVAFAYLQLIVSLFLCGALIYEIRHTQENTKRFIEWRTEVEAYKIPEIKHE